MCAKDILYISILNFAHLKKCQIDSLVKTISESVQKRHNKRSHQTLQQLYREEKKNI